MMSELTEGTVESRSTHMTSEPKPSDVENIPDGLKAYRRAAQWLSLQARADEAGLDRLADSIGGGLDDWANLATALAHLAQEEGTARRGGDAEAWAAHAASLAATAYRVEGSVNAQGALADQVRAREGDAGSGHP